MAGTDLQTPVRRHIQAADQTGRHQRSGGVQLLGDALGQAHGVTGELQRSQTDTHTRVQRALQHAHACALRPSLPSYHVDKGRDEDQDNGKHSDQGAVGARLHNLL